MSSLQRSPGEKLRIDRWLFFTRFYKTRSLASEAVAGGHVRLNGVRVSPGQRVAVGDVIELVRNRMPYKLVVEAIPGRRGPAAEARTCYTEDAKVAEQRNELLDGLRRDRMSMPRTDGRPDKHTRRQLRQRSRDGGH